MVVQAHAPNAQDLTTRRYCYKGAVDETQRTKDKTNSKVRAKVEHPFLVIKRLVGFSTTRYRRLAKNPNRFFLTCVLVNRCRVPRRLLRLV